MNIPELVHFLHCCQHLLSDLDQRELVLNASVCQVGLNGVVDIFQFDILVGAVEAVAVVLRHALQVTSIQYSKIVCFFGYRGTVGLGHGGILDLDGYLMLLWELGVFVTEDLSERALAQLFLVVVPLIGKLYLVWVVLRLGCFLVPILTIPIMITSMIILISS